MSPAFFKEVSMPSQLRTFGGKDAGLGPQQTALFDYLLANKNQYIPIPRLADELHVTDGRIMQLYRGLLRLFEDVAHEYIVFTKGLGIKLIVEE